MTEEAQESCQIRQSQKCNRSPLQQDLSQHTGDSAEVLGQEKNKGSTPYQGRTKHHEPGQRTASQPYLKLTYMIRLFIKSSYVTILDMC